MRGSKSRYSRLQECFLMRASRLGLLLLEYCQHDDPPDERMALICWAMHSILTDCDRLGVGPEARALMATEDDR
jgi:hypothetical protein